MESNAYNQIMLETNWGQVIFLALILVCCLWFLFRYESDRTETRQRELDQLYNLNKDFDEEEEISVRDMTAEELRQIRDEELQSLMAELKLYEVAKANAYVSPELAEAVRQYEEYNLNEERG